jgi:hypothetical protein
VTPVAGAALAARSPASPASIASIASIARDEASDRVPSASSARGEASQLPQATSVRLDASAATTPSPLDGPPDASTQAATTRANSARLRSPSGGAAGSLTAPPSVRVSGPPDPFADRK